MDGPGAAHCAARRAVGDSSSASSQHGVGGGGVWMRTGGWKLGGGDKRWERVGWTVER